MLGSRGMARRASGFLLRDASHDCAMPLSSHLRKEHFQGLRIDIVEHQPCAFTGKQHCGGAANTTGGASHDGNFVFEPH